MTQVPTQRRPHLVERAVEAARAATPVMEVRPVPAPAPIATAPTPPSAPPDEHEAPARLARAVLVRAGLIDGSGARLRPREEIALVRDQILRGIAAAAPDHERAANLLLVTSARPGEGKSFIALNLAASIAEGAGRPTILVDIDGGRGALTDRLGLAAAPGLDALLEPGASVDLAQLVPTEMPGFSVLPHGAAWTQSTPHGGALKSALLGLAAAYRQHILVLDSPACLVASTAGLVAAVAGQVVMVVEAERTQRAELEAALDIVDACPDLRLLLNRARLKVSDSFGAPSPMAGDGDRGAPG
jgi:receptor protein-tyrosine kinase